MTTTETFQTITYDTKQTAAELRKALRAAFPSAKFTVRMSTGTAYGWIGVHYTDGPTLDAVNTVADQFESSRFNGMTDNYDRVEPTMYMIGGVPTVIRYSCCGVNVSRHLSDAALDWAWSVAASDPGRWSSLMDPVDPVDPLYYAKRRVLAETDLRTVTI